MRSVRAGLAPNPGRRPAGLDKAGFESKLAQAVSKIQKKYPQVNELADQRYVGDPALVDPAGWAPLTRAMLLEDRRRPLTSQ